MSPRRFSDEAPCWSDDEDDYEPNAYDKARDGDEADACNQWMDETQLEAAE